MNTHMKKANWTYFLFGFPKYSKNNSLQYKDAHCLFLSKVNKNKSHLENQPYLYCLLKPAENGLTSGLSLKLF